MSNGGWQPPQSGNEPPSTPGPGGPPAEQFAPPAGAYAPPGQPGQPVDLESSNQPPARSKGKILAAGIGAVAIVGAGIFAVTRISGDSTSGGAGSPEEAGQAFVDALGNEDLLGAIDVLLPGERETMREPLSELVDNLRRIEVLSDGADLSDIGGFEIEVLDSEIEVDETNADDIANLTITIDATASINGDDLPIGDLILDNVDADPSDLDVGEERTDDNAQIPLTAVQKDGRWYLSLFYTAAEQARIATTGDDIPGLEDAIAPNGGATPEDAFDSFVAGLENLDVEAIIASLNPNEFEALQRYAPLFLDDAQDGLDEAGLNISLDEPEYTVSGEGDTRSMTISYLSGEISAARDTVSFTWEDGCLTLTPPERTGEETINTCELMNDPALDDMFEESSEDVQRFIDTLSAAFDDYENPGFIVKQVDGQWFLSPMATGSEQMLAVLRAIDRDEIEEIAETGRDAFEDFIADISNGGAGLPTDFDDFDDFDFEPDVDFDADGPDADFDDGADTTDDVDDFGDDGPEYTIPGVEVPDFTLPDITLPGDD